MLHCYDREKGPKISNHGMPIYKIPSRRSTGRRAQNTFKWVRLVALVLSGLLISGTILMFLHSGN